MKICTNVSKFVKLKFLDNKTRGNLESS